MIGLLGVALAAPTAVVAPAVDTVPVNHLKWYVRFSEPMRPVRTAMAHVELIDETVGEPVALAFSQLAMWSPDRRSLTALFHPGRQKRGVGFAAELGPVLVEGHAYTLRVTPGLRPVDGEPMVEAVEHRFVAGPADRVPPDPETWTVQPPADATAPVVLDLGEAVDPFLAERAFRVVGPGGEVAVRATVDGTQLQLHPPTAWATGDHRVEQVGRIEDLAGNVPGALFDDVAARKAAAAPFIAPFAVR